MTLVFLDIESTGLHRLCRPWEIGIIRRARDGSERSINIFVNVCDIDLPNADPKGLHVGRFEERHPERGGRLPAGDLLVRESEAAQLVRQWTADALVYGVYPEYDVKVLRNMLDRHALEPTWAKKSPQDVAVLADKWLRSIGKTPERSNPARSEQCGVPYPPPHLRHTAMGDADWVKRWFAMLESQGAVPV